MVIYSPTNDHDVLIIDEGTSQVENTTIVTSKTAEEQLSHDAGLSSEHSTETLARKVNHTCSDQPINPTLLVEEGTYQAIISDVTWIMSAHVDPRREDILLVRLFGVSSEMSNAHGEDVTLYCQMWDEEKHLIATASSRMINLYRFGFK
jgi:hypothetical protein